MLRFIQAWLGMNPDLPFAHTVENPVDGQAAKNRRWQKVIYDSIKQKWVMPQNYSGKKPVTVTRK